MPRPVGSQPTEFKKSLGRRLGDGDTEVIVGLPQCTHEGLSKAKAEANKYSFSVDPISQLAILPLNFPNLSRCCVGQSCWTWFLSN